MLVILLKLRELEGAGVLEKCLQCIPYGKQSFLSRYIVLQSRKLVSRSIFSVKTCLLFYQSKLTDCLVDSVD